MMNKIAVLYYSKYGSTKQYAEWIAQEVGGDLLDARQTKIKQLVDYDTIVYGGGIYSGGIKGIELITKNWYKGLSEKKVIVFAVGIAVESEANQEQCLDINFKKRFVTDAEDAPEEGTYTMTELLKERRLPISCFFLPGTFDPKGIKGFDKAVMKLVRHMMDTGAQGDSVEGRIAGYMENGCDLTNKKYIAPVVAAIREE